MIEFECLNCGRPMKVTDEAAGRKGKCKVCGKTITVPSPVVLAAPRLPKPVEQEYFPPQIIVPNQVNVRVNTPRGNGTAVASLVLGIVALCFFWMPFVGLGLGAFAAFLSIVSLIVAVFRSGAGIGYTLGGICVSVAAIFAGIPSSLVGAAFVAPAIQQAQRAAEKTKLKQVEAQQPWPPPNQETRIGDVILRFEKVEVSPVTYKSQFGGDMTTEDPMMKVWFTIENTSQNKKLKYRGLMASTFLVSDQSEATDNFGNTYDSKDMLFRMEQIEGVERSLDFYPGKKFRDVVIFERPVDGAVSIKVRIPKTRLDSPEDIRYEIPL